MKHLTRGEKSFMQWLQKTNPQFYTYVIMQQQKNNLGAVAPIVATEPPPSFLDKLADLATGFYEFDLQKQTIEHQIDIAQQNKQVDLYYGQNVPPLNVPGFQITPMTAGLGIAALVALFTFGRRA